MMVSDLAVLDLQMRRDRMVRALRDVRWRVRGRGEESPPPPTADQPATEWESDTLLEEMLAMAMPINHHEPADESRFRWRRHPRLRDVPMPPPLSPAERRARQAAVQGLFLAREGNYAAAGEAFAEAAADHSLQLEAVPTFWQLPRPGQDIAVQAYEATGRLRDAAALATMIQQRYTPRPLPTRPAEKQREGDPEGQRMPPLAAVPR